MAMGNFWPWVNMAKNCLKQSGFGNKWRAFLPRSGTHNMLQHKKKTYLFWTSLEPLKCFNPFLKQFAKPRSSKHFVSFVSLFRWMLLKLNYIAMKALFGPFSPTLAYNTSAFQSHIVLATILRITLNFRDISVQLDPISVTQFWLTRITIESDLWAGTPQRMTTNMVPYCQKPGGVSWLEQCYKCVELIDGLIVWWMEYYSGVYSTWVFGELGVGSVVNLR